jgi:hypothetical protein
MDIDALASEFGSGNVSPNADNAGVDIHGLASEFGSKDKAKEISKLPENIRKVYITPAPPISDAPADYQPAQGIQGGANPRDTALAEGIRNYIPSIGNAIADNASEGASNFSSGLGDVVNKGELKSGSKKMGVGALQAITAIPAGIASEGVGKPITELTGNPDIGDRAAFVAGSAIPVAPGLSAISKLRPSNVALKDLISNITNNGANPENLVPVVQRMKNNPRIGPADVSPAVQSATQKLFATEGDTAKNYLATTSANRMKSSPTAVDDAYNIAGGIPVDAVKKLASLAQSAKDVGAKEINPALTNSRPVDLSGTLEHIDKQLKPGVNSVITSGSALPFPEVKAKLANFRKLLANETEMRTGAQDIHGLQSALREHAEGLLNSSSGSDRQLGYALMQVRNKIVDDIDKASGGKYKPALSNYRDEKDIAKSFREGYDGVLSNSKQMENLPEFTKQWLDSLTKEEKEAVKEGVRLRVRAEMGVAKNPSLAGQNIAKSEFNKEKMELVLGKEETNSLIQKLEDEKSIANTHNKVFEGSQTAQRISSESKRDLPKPTEKGSGLSRLASIASYVGPEVANYYGTGYAIPGLGLAASTAAGVAGHYGTKAKDAIKLSLAKENNAQYAKLALPTEGPEREALIKSLEAAIPGPKQSIMRRASRLSNHVGP